jgi:hypothetical protein
VKAKPTYAICSLPHDPVPDDYFPDQAFWASLVEWRDGFAKRRGLGQIYKRAFENLFVAGPVWKEFLGLNLDKAVRPCL